MSEYFPKPKSLGTNVKVKLDLSNYATQLDLKNATVLYTMGFAKKTDLVKNVPNNLTTLKSKVDNLDIGKLLLQLMY